MMLSERLKLLRNKMGLSQYQVADRLGISRGKLANYEQGSRQPDFETLDMLANFYNCSTDYLLGRTDLTKGELGLLEDLNKELSVDELKDKYNLTIDGKVATRREIEGAIAFIRSIRDMK